MYLIQIYTIMTTLAQDEKHQGDFFHICFSNSVSGGERELMKGVAEG